MSEVCKVAAVQAAPSFLNLAEGIQRAEAFIEEAASKGCKLVVFPETWLPGYPNHIWLGPVAWQMQFVGRYFDSSIEAGSDEDKAIAEAARRNNIQVSIGVSERDGGSLYISQWHYGEDGDIISRRRKLKPTHVERTVFGEGDGSDLAVKETSIGRVGQLSCWEHLQPLSKYAMYAQNEQIHCAAWPNFSLYRGMAYALGDVVNNAASMMYAVEGGCYVIAPCATVSKAQQDMLCQGDPEKEGMCQVGGGYTKIYAPDGQSIGSEIGETEEGLVVADIDLSMIPYAKAVADPAGHYAKKDATRLLIDREKRRAVVEVKDLDASKTAMSELATTGQEEAVEVASERSSLLHRLKPW
ncbi:carbon-nitrogen hydrolase family protein [Enterovibrio sp. ZSDZ35]|uniref:Carbon-nitrogen hydrolase family protein n=1 Tax=Enterovibrio qingdaonensis TaxID=2899818 RepID=A0ABT5QIF3_9GAMM|nr:carbon-nitrogen hydrolase family protein [Enterovibrio sp. ZSDZ35]MDD1780404.1 carbon-nitrogen hydrolase family protein [Enterovibrio sp. ZSDZ35]